MNTLIFTFAYCRYVESSHLICSLLMNMIQSLISNKDFMNKHYINAEEGTVKFSHFALKNEVINLLDNENMRKPTVVQAESLPLTLQENLKNLCTILYAYNGAGKTLAFLLPILNSLEMVPCTSSDIVKGKERVRTRPQAIIVFPTEALMSQVYEYLESYASFYESQYKWRLTIGKCYGGEQTAGHIIVGMTAKVSSSLQNFDFSELKWVVFDQCDSIKQISLEFFKRILELFSQKTQGENYLITSATGEKQELRNFIQQNLRHHNIVEIDTKEEDLGLLGVTHYFSKMEGAQKDNSIFKILYEMSARVQKIGVIIFFNHIKELRAFWDRLVKEKDLFVVNNDSLANDRNKNKLSADYVHVECVPHSNIRKHRCPDDCQRSKSNRVSRLRNRQIQLLLGTEAIGRGIDIRTVSLVINYSEPIKNKQYISSVMYIHRVGRTGRYSDQGIALTYVSSDKLVDIVTKEQKVEFKQMKSESEVLEEAFLCFYENQKLNQDSKHPYAS